MQPERELILSLGVKPKGVKKREKKKKKKQKKKK